jgi:general secretion pathway protein G
MRRKSGLLTLALVALALLAVALFVPCISADSPAKARERVLRQDVFEMRAFISQYTLDLRKRPQSIDDLVAAGYFKHVPTDPMTGRNDTWVVEWSNDPKMPGIVGIRSGAGHR